MRCKALIVVVLVYPYSWSPGVRNPDMTEQKLCSSSFRTKQIRPPEAYTNKLKRQQLAAHPEIDCQGSCEEDHVWPIEAGGDPRNPRNLSPQPVGPGLGWKQKDKVENYWHAQICQGLMKIDDVGPQIPHWQEIYEHNFNRRSK